METGPVELKKDLVYQGIKYDIARGRYQVGEKLPREIDFAAERGVSFITMRSALKMLEHDNESTIRNFFHSFRQNLIQGIGISLLLLGFGGMLLFDVQFMMKLTFSAGQAGNDGLPFPVLCGGWVICVLLAMLLLFFL